jgi:hypothetical protein
LVAHVRRGADLGFDDDALLAIPEATFDGLAAPGLGGVGTIDAGGTLRWWDGTHWLTGPAVGDGPNCLQSRPESSLRFHHSGANAVPIDVNYPYAQLDTASCLSPPTVLDAARGRLTAFRDGPRGMVATTGQAWQAVPLGRSTSDLAPQYSERVSPYPFELMSPEHVTLAMRTDPATQVFSPDYPAPVLPHGSWRTVDRLTENLWWPYRILRDPMTKRVRLLTSRGAMWELGGQVLHGLGEPCVSGGDCAVGSCNAEGVCCDVGNCGSTLCTTCKGTTPGVCQAVPAGQPDVQGKCGGGACAGVCGADRKCAFDPTRACGTAPTCANGVVSAGGRCDDVSPACVLPEQMGQTCQLSASTGAVLYGHDVTGKPCRVPDGTCGGGLGCGSGTACKTTCVSRVDCKGGYTCGPGGASCVADSATVAANAFGVTPVDVKLPRYKPISEMADELADAGYPRVDGGGVAIPTISFGGIVGVVDPSHRTPAMSYRACVNYLAVCMQATKKVDGCVASAPRCVTSTPWLGDPAGDDCCPESCLAEYFVDRQTMGPSEALGRWRTSGCYPSEPGYYDGGLP